MRSKRNNNLVGNKRDTNVYTRGNSVWDANEVNILKHNANIPYESEIQGVSDAWPQSADYDPMRGLTTVHFSSEGTKNHMYRDYSGNGWDNYITSSSTDRAPLITSFGPRYRDWSTLFFQDGYYSVNNYDGIQLGTSAFTIEFWIKRTRNDATEMYVMGKGGQAARGSGSGWVIYLTSSYQIGFYDAVGSYSALQTATTLTADTWYHVAIVRENTSLNGTKFYLNGQLAVTGSCNGDFNDTSTMFISRDRVATSASQFKGYLTDIRITKSAVYTSAFTAPTAALDMSSATFSLSMTKPHHDNIPSAHTNGAVIRRYGQTYRWLDSPHLPTAPLAVTGNGASSIQTESGWQPEIFDENSLNTGLRLGTSPFTVECWVYRNSHDTNCGIVSKGGGNKGSGNGWSLIVLSDGRVEWNDGASTITGDANTAAQMCGWYHVAAVRSNTSTNGFSLFVNGRKSVSGTVATDYNDTMPLRLASARERQYTHHGYLSGLRISNTAIYTANSNVETVQFIDTSMAAYPSNTRLMMFKTEDDRPNDLFHGYYNYGLDHQMSIKYKQTVPHVGGRTHITLEDNVKSQAWYYGSYPRMIANTSLGDFNFSTGDFSIEFWHRNYVYHPSSTDQRFLMDMRHRFADKGLAIRSRGDTGQFEIHANGQCILTTSNDTFDDQKWIHYCIQRVDNKIAFYTNGKKRSETIYTDSIFAQNNRITFGNSSYINLHYGSHCLGHMCDIRVLKGAAAYARGTNNPDYFDVPRKKLSVIPGTVLLTARGAPLRDESGRDNFVGSGGEVVTTVQGTLSDGGWGVSGAMDVPMGHFSPYSDCETYSLDWAEADNTQDYRTMYYSRGIRHTTNYPELSWMGRLAKPWTLEFWFFAHNTNPSSVTTIRTVYTSDSTAGHRGWEFIYHYNGTAGSWGDLTFRWNNATTEFISTTGNSTSGIFAPHNFNHVAIVYDPTKQNKIGMFLNGKRVAVKSGFTPINEDYYTYGLNTDWNCGSIRLSTIARYDNALTTYTMPRYFEEDEYTYTLVGRRHAIPERTKSTSFRNYESWASMDYGKFGKSLKFTPRSNRAVFIDISNNYWNPVEFDTRYGDFTWECWAAWLDPNSGGRAYGATGNGNTLWHYNNALGVGITQTGKWEFAWFYYSGATKVYYNTNGSSTFLRRITDADVKVVTYNNRDNFNHICVVRRNNTLHFYVDGVEKTTLLNSYVGNYGNAAFGPSDNTWMDHVNNYTLRLGDNWSSVYNEAWGGFIEDFRATAMARYETRVVNGVATMCHAGTSVPALPIKPLPTR